jgi:hypothetical protein
MGDNLTCNPSKYEGPQKKNLDYIIRLTDYDLFDITPSPFASVFVPCETKNIFKFCY